MDQASRPQSRQLRLSESHPRLAAFGYASSPLSLLALKHSARGTFFRGKVSPDLPASLMFDPDEIKAAYVLTNKPSPSAPPSLNEVVRRVAMLGGFLARKGDGEPGVKTIWIGLQRVMDFAAGVRFMRDSSDGMSCV